VVNFTIRQLFFAIKNQGPFWRSEKSHGHAGIENSGPSSRSLVAMSEALISLTMWTTSQSQWPRGLRCGSAAVRLLGLRVHISSEAWMSVSYECCVLLGRVPCDGPLTHPEESYGL
jgi:hypothetical protein